MMTIKDIQQLALIGARLELSVSEAVYCGKLLAVNNDTLRIACRGTTRDVRIADIQRLSVLADTPDRDSFNQLAERYRELIGFAKTTPIKLYKFYEDKLASLIEKLEESKLKSFFQTKNFLSGAVPSELQVQPHLELLKQATLSEDERDFAYAILYTAFHEYGMAMQVWLRHHQPTGQLDDAFVNKYGLLLALTSTGFSSRNATFTVASTVASSLRETNRKVPKQVRLDRLPIFMFLSSQLLRVSPEQLTKNEDVWVRYLLQCVVFNSFGALKEYFWRCEDNTFVYATLRDLFLLMDEYTWAWQAAQQSVPIKKLLLHLPERITYGVRLARCAELLIEKKLLGRMDVGCIFEYNREHESGLIVSGCLHELNFQVKNQPGLKNLCEQIASQFSTRLDYDPALLHIDEDGKISPLEGDEQK